MSDVSVAAVIHTLNEENNIANAVRSAFLLAAEVFVVDMHSNDRTVEIAREAGARVIKVARTGGVDPARAEIMAGMTSDWVLVLDADEIIGPSLAARRREIAREGSAGGCQIVCVRGVGFLRKDDTDDHDRQGCSGGASAGAGGGREAAA